MSKASPSEKDDDLSKDGSATDIGGGLETDQDGSSQQQISNSGLASRSSSACTQTKTKKSTSSNHCNSLRQERRSHRSLSIDQSLPSYSQMQLRKQTSFSAAASVASVVCVPSTPAPQRRTRSPHGHSHPNSLSHSNSISQNSSSRPAPTKFKSVASISSPLSNPPSTRSASFLGEWTSVPTSGTAPCQRSLHAAAVLNECMYVFGGYDGQERVNDFYSFNFTEGVWTELVPNQTSDPPPSPRDRHVLVAHDHSFYVFGGFDGTARVNDFFEFDLSAMVWKKVIAVSGNPPTGRHSHAAVVHDSSMWVFGGYDGSYRSDFHQYDFLSKTWTSIPSRGRPPRARYRATAVIHENTMLLFGGHDGTRHLSDTHIFDFDTQMWSSLLTADGVSPVPRDSHVSVVHGDSMYVFGGSTGSAMNDLFELHLPGTTDTSFDAKWRPIKCTVAGSPIHRFCHVGIVYQDSFFVFGGYDGSTRLNDFIKFDFSVDDLTCEVPPSTLVSDLRAFLNDESLSDITFIVDDHPVYAHKIMLMRCSYFRAMFLGDMIESNKSTIRIESVTHAIFISLLEYLYTDEVNIPLDAAMELFVAADLFCIPRLKSICEKTILSSITIENAATIFHAADLHSAKLLRTKSIKYILAHFEAVSKSVAFEEMARGNVELVFEILRNR